VRFLIRSGANVVGGGLRVAIEVGHQEFLRCEGPALHSFLGGTPPIARG
jgi:hypothetical protein